MQIPWVAVLLFAGVVLAGNRHDTQEYPVSTEVQDRALECEHAQELKEVVNSLKHLKTCLCKLINVQKKQIELEIERTKAAQKAQAVAAAQDLTTDVLVARVDKPVAESQPQNTPSNGGSTVDITITANSGSVEPTDAEGATVLADDRSKRHTQVISTDFKEIQPDELTMFMERGFTTDSHEEYEKKFLTEHPTSEPGAASLTVVQDRKARETEAEGEAEEEQEQEPAVAVPQKTIVKQKAVVAEEIIEEEEPAEEEHVQAIAEPVAEEPEEEVAVPEAPVMAVSPKQLTKAFNQMEKRKKSTKATLPRQQSMEFPAGATYYDNAAQQKPMDYTLNMPQQTYYFVPGPTPGQNRLVAAPFGNYGQEPAFTMNDQSVVGPSLNAQFAPGPVTMDEMPGAGGQVMSPDDYSAYPMYGGAAGGHVQYLPYPEGEEEMAPPQPAVVTPVKEKRRRRKSKAIPVEAATEAQEPVQVADE